MGFGVGDVAGHGVHAAAIMGQLRTALRTAASADLPAVDSLRLLDGQLAELLSTESQEEGIVEFATALYATFEPHDGLLRIAVAGHLPPLIITPDGISRRIDSDPGAPLGLHTGKVGEIAVPLPPRATVALSPTAWWRTVTPTSTTGSTGSSAA
ncbi:MAG: PP2C family protein-serine/threonine phosphatase [Streptomycetales bacterium]